MLPVCGAAPKVSAVQLAEEFRRRMEMEYPPVLVPMLSSTMILCAPVVSSWQVTSRMLVVEHLVVPAGRTTSSVVLTEPDVSATRIRT